MNFRFPMCKKFLDHLNNNWFKENRGDGSLVTGLHCRLWQLLQTQHPSPDVWPAGSCCCRLHIDRATSESYRRWRSLNTPRSKHTQDVWNHYLLAFLQTPLTTITRLLLAHWRIQLNIQVNLETSSNTWILWGQFLYNTVLTICTTCFYSQKFCTSPTDCIYGFRKILWRNRCYFLNIN